MHPRTHKQHSNNSIFLIDPTLETLSLLYNCDNNSISSSGLTNNRFSCDIYGDTEEGFYVINSNPYNLYSTRWRKIECKTSIQVPILPSNGSSLGEVLKEGFDVSYVDPYSADCTRCYKKHPGGYCGFDAQLGKPICICSDQLCPGFSRSGRRQKIAAGISAIVTTIITFSIITIYLTRKEGSFSAVTTMIFRLKNPLHVERVKTFMMNYRSLTPKRYSYSDIKKMTNSFVNTIGQGGFGNVYRGKLPDDGRLVAVKVLKESKGDGEEFMNEVASISRTSHVNVVTLLGFCYERNKRALIYEFMPNGSLDSFISDKGTNCRLERKKLYEIAVGIARGLEYLHRGCNTRIVHFDIKPHNILLDEDFCPKISDFGLAKLCKSNVSKISMIGARGTVGYIAPEVFCRNFGGVTYKSDVYSYGMMVLEMVGQSKDFDMGSLETVTETKSIKEEEMLKDDLGGLSSKSISMTKVVEMFEGSLQSLQIPPRPSLNSPRRSAQEHSSTVSSLPCESSQGSGVNKLTADESDSQLEIANFISCTGGHSVRMKRKDCKKDFYGRSVIRSNNPSDRPSMTKVVEMLEGSLQILQTPSNPFLYSPTRSSVMQLYSTLSNIFLNRFKDLCYGYMFKL
uniref:non-specific serine/threonine protein kinase n=1 Tax=Salix viminalis TaxID=40686 RepID=A0A6N2KA35_SALVM